MAAFQLSGSLEEIPLPDIARLFQSTRKTGRLALVSGKSTGFLFFDRGDIVDCQTSNMAGIDALKHLALFNRGSFEFHDGVAPASQSLKNEATTITTTELIEVMENRMMESRQLQELVPVSNEVPRYLGGALPSDLELGAADLLIAMKCAPGAHSVAWLARDLNLDERMVSYTVARFRAAGLMEIVGVADDVPEEAEVSPASSTIVPPPRTSDSGPVPNPTPSAGPRYWRGRKIEG
jgi:hypothetical protein